MSPKLKALLLPMIGMLLASSGAAVELAPGDIVVVDSLNNLVIRVDPVVGNQTIVSSGGSFSQLYGIAIEPTGAIVVSDTFIDTIFRVDPASGAQTIVSSGGILESPLSLAVEASGDILVGDAGANAIIRVDPETGDQSVVSFGGSLPRPVGIALDGSGNIYAVGGNPDSVVRVDPVSGGQTVISSGGLLGFGNAIAVAEDGDLFVTDRNVPHAILRIDPVSGSQSVVASGSPPGILGTPVGIVIDEFGDLLVTDASFQPPPRGAVARVDPDTGEATVLSSGGSFAQLAGIAIFAACLDGIDNDRDGLVDYPEDPGCTRPADTSELPGNPAPKPPQGEIELNFQGATIIDVFDWPPDTVGAVGEDHIVEVVNSGFLVFDKVDGSRVLFKQLAQFFIDSGVTPTPGFVFDPRVLYDPATRRWFVSAADGFPFFPFGDPTESNNFLIAASNTPDPTGPWTGFKILSDSTGLRWADFPTLGIDADGIYLSARMFPLPGTSSLRTTLVVLPKQDLIGPTPSIYRATVFENLPLSTLGSPVQPVADLDDSGLPAALLSLPRDLLSAPAEIIRSNITGNIASPSLQPAAARIPVDPLFRPPRARQPGPKQDLETAFLGFNSEVVRRNGSFWATDNVAIAGRGAVRWFQIDAETNAVLQTGIVADRELDLFYPSIAVNEFGDIVMGFNGSSESQFASAYAVVGETRDGVTSFGDLILLKEGTADYELLEYGRNRWGDYSATVVDPSDPQVFWTFQEVAGLSGVSDLWATQITKIRLVADEIVVSIDVKPGSDPNSINPFSKGLIPVAVLGTEDVDVANLDVATLAFGPNGAPVAHRNGPHFEDVNDDGFTDLLGHYQTQETGIAPGDMEACVTGEALDGRSFEGCDAIRTVPPPRCGTGWELAVLLPPIWSLRRRLVRRSR